MSAPFDRGPTVWYYHRQMEEEKECRRRFLGGRAIGILALGLSLAITISIFALGPRLKELAGYGYAAVFILGLLGNATVIIPVPSLVGVGAAAAYGLNPLLLGLASAPGEALGELTGYLAGYGGRAAMEEQLSRRFGRQVESWMRRRGDLVIFLLAAIPNPLFDLAGMTAGVLRFPVWRFLLFCGLGKMCKAWGIALAAQLLT